MNSQKSEELIKTPKHVAIIMDGNRRWAVHHGKEYIEGHREAINRIEEIVDYCVDAGIEYLTLWVWSTKNWKRNKNFIRDIFTLFREQLGPNGVFARSVEKGAKLHHIGALRGFPVDIQRKVSDFFSKEPEEEKIIVNVALGYEGRDEIIRAIHSLVKDGVPVNEINQELLGNYLDTKGQPDVDFVIRIGGDQRTSGFLIWQAADAELYFTNTYMPDFGVSEFKKALQDYASRERRLGGDSQQY